MFGRKKRDEEELEEELETEEYDENEETESDDDNSEEADPDVEYVEDSDPDEEEEVKSTPKKSSKKDKKEKPKNDRIIKMNPIYSYKFWFKIFGAVLLVILGFVLIFGKEEATAIVLMFTGGVFCLYSIIRVVPLMKTLEKGFSKLFCFIEILLDFVVGVILIALSIKNFGDELTGFAKFSSEHYNVLIGFVLWLRGFVYFLTTILFAEKTDKLQFFVHIAVITFGSYLFGVKIDAKKIALALAILSFICGAVIAGSGFFDYGRYRNKVKDVREKKDDKKKKTTSKKKEAPARKDNEKIDDPENRLPIVDHDDDRPYVN